MGVYREFNPGDILQSIVHSAPLIELASGTISGTVLGWHGNVGVSSSLSLYGGIRGRMDVKASDFTTSGLSVYPLDPLDTHSIDKVLLVSGSYPATGSVEIVTVRHHPAPNFTDVTKNDWYEEHFSPILGCFDWYSQYRSLYFTGSHDYYSLYFSDSPKFFAPAVLHSGSGLPTLTGSFTMEAMVKPISVTGSRDFTVQSQRHRWKFYVTGSTGQLAFSDFSVVLTSSDSLIPGRWQHVAFRAGASSASFYVNGVISGEFSYTGSLASYAGAFVTTASFMTVGAEYVSSGSVPVIVPDMGFKGFIFESRVWDTKLSELDLIASGTTTLFSSGSSHLVHYARFNDGPLGKAHGQVIGSGAFDYSHNHSHGQFVNFDLFPVRGPSWQPNDNPTFVTSKTRIDDQVDIFKVIHVPSMFYGRQIATGSVQLTCNAYNNEGIVRVIKDDGLGGLYLSGSLTRNISGEEYPGVIWRKVGNIFYTEGLIVITDPSMLDFGQNVDWSGSPDLLQVTFRGQNRSMVKVFMCRIGPTQGNASNNPTFAYFDDRGTPELDDDRMIVRDHTTYITSVGIYNEERKLVAVAKLAQPIRKRQKDKINLRLKLDF